MDVALVTGASSGIGLAIAGRLVEMGYSVYGYARDHGKSSYRHSRFHPVDCDVTDTRALIERTEALVRETGGLKILVNNAGIGFFGPHATMAPDRIERMVRTNLIAPMILTRATLRHLEKSKGVRRQYRLHRGFEPRALRRRLRRDEGRPPPVRTGALQRGKKKRRPGGDPVPGHDADALLRRGGL